MQHCSSKLGKPAQVKTESVPTAVLKLDTVDLSRWLNYAIKFALVASFAVALLVPIAVLEGKGMGVRAPVFTAPVWVVPLLAYVRKWRPYPHVADALLGVPFVLDTVGNILGLFDSIVIFDDVLHFVNWAFLVGAFHAFRFRNVHDSRDAVFLGAGFGALAIVFWELIEWIVSVDGLALADNLQLTYGDTVGDLVISTTGGIVGSWLAVRFLGPTR